MAHITSNPLPDEFPRYSDGDVLIVLSQSRQYQLHSRTLVLHSDYFKRALAEDKATILSAKARREGATIRFRLELELAHGKDSGVGRFWLRPLDERGRPQVAYTATDLDAGKSALPIYHHYDNLFRLYYYQPASLNDTNISEVLQDVVGLADVAEHLGSMHAVSLVIDNALVKQGQVLYRSIASNAAAWGDLAFRVRSELIFREALIHMVGQWPKLSQSRDVMDTMRPEIHTLCKIKHRELDDTKRAIELRIMGHYPQHMQRPTNNNVGPGSHTIRGTGKSTRANAYASDAFAWMALNLFRHWLGQHVCGDMNRHAADGGFNFYHAIRKAGDAYIDHNAVESFAKYFPLSAKARNAFVTQLNILKEGVRSYVDSLVENRSMLDITKWPVRYLTCLHVKKTDMPWLITDDTTAHVQSVRSAQYIHPAATTTIDIAAARVPPNSPSTSKRRRTTSPTNDEEQAYIPPRLLRRQPPPNGFPSTSLYHADGDAEDEYNDNGANGDDADEDGASSSSADYDDSARDEDYNLPDVRVSRRQFRRLQQHDDMDEDEVDIDNEDGEVNVEMDRKVDYVDAAMDVDAEGDVDDAINMSMTAPVAPMMAQIGYTGVIDEVDEQDNELRRWMVERGA